VEPRHPFPLFKKRFFLEYLDISNQQDCIGLYDTKLSVINSLSSLKTFYLDRLTLINDKDSFD
jgi:hypothetical protein